MKEKYIKLLLKRCLKLDETKALFISYNVINRDFVDEVVNYAYDIGVRNAFIQEGETCKDSFIPIFTDELEIIKENV